MYTCIFNCKKKKILTIKFVINNYSKKEINGPDVFDLMFKQSN